MVSQKSVVVTGASTGIGRACVKVLVSGGFRVFAGVRKAEDAERLGAEFGASVTPLLFDVTDEAAVRRAAEETAAALGPETLAGLVNNAGVAVPGPLLYVKPDDFRRQIEVNLTAQLVVTQAFAPLLGADRSLKGSPGRIVMMSSVGGKNATPFLGPYCASKFALEGLSEALRRELLLFGIDVVIIAPGAIATPIWDKADGAASQFAGTPYRPAMEKLERFMLDLGRKGLPPERVGEAVLRALTARRPPTRIEIAPNPLQTLLSRALPKRVVDRIMARRLGLTPAG